MQSLAAIN